MSRNEFATWNNSPSSSDRSTNARDAANRIFDGFFKPENLPDAVSFSRADGLFTMGSCFAREIEAALRKLRFNILSMDLDLLAASHFSDDKGIRTGFFHRFNVPSMELEFRRSLGDVDFDERHHLLVEANGIVDLNYHILLARLDLEGAAERRRVGRQMVSRFRQARAIVITLGLTEAWFHEPSGMYCNGVPPDVIARRRSELTFRRIDYEENRSSLQRIYDFIERHHETGEYSLFVTISPVPLQHTFSEQDIVVANFGSKAVLRAAAEDFCLSNPKAVYFPSYEIAMFSQEALVWRPDRLHVLKGCVKHITDLFVDRYATAA